MKNIRQMSRGELLEVQVRARVRGCYATAGAIDRELTSRLAEPAKAA